MISVEVIVPEAIFNELTQNRIKASYSELSTLINEHRYNHQFQNAIKVEAIEHEDESTLELHEYIKTESGLDDGEVDGIMLSILTQHSFITNDSDAIEFFNEGLEHETTASASSFENFLDDLLQNGVIDKKEYDLLMEAKK